MGSMRLMPPRRSSPAATKRPRVSGAFLISGRPDLNRGPHRPERCALPGCATPRRRAAVSHSGGVRYRAEPMALLNAMLVELDRLLDPDSFADHGPNGLQVQGCAEVTHVATGVSATLELFERAIEAGADLILTHHGLFWDGDDARVVGVLRDRLRLLLGANVSL